MFYITYYALGCSNVSSSSFVHVNLTLGFNRDQNGAMQCADANANDTWYTSPNQLRMSVIVFGVGKF